jgi:hypothetical protein
MSPVSKSPAHKALEFAARAALDTQNNKAKLSNQKMQEAMKTLSGAEKEVVSAFARLVHDGFRTESNVSKNDVARAMAFAKRHLLKRYELDEVTLTDEELEELSHAADASRALAKALKSLIPPKPSREKK